MIPIKQEKRGDHLAEECAICRTKTRSWTDLPDRAEGEQVACCKRCAARNDPRDVPTKEEWCLRGDPEAKARAEARKAAAAKAAAAAPRPTAKRRVRPSAWTPSPDGPAAVAAFNEAYPVGAPVEYRRGETRQRTRTTSAAELSGDLGFVCLEGEPASVSIQLVKPPSRPRKEGRLGR